MDGCLRQGLARSGGVARGTGSDRSLHGLRACDVRPCQWRRTSFEAVRADDSGHALRDRVVGWAVHDGNVQKRPTTLSVAIRVCRWADAQACEPLEPHLVPGANDRERARLRALGPLVGAIATGDRATWPDQVRQWAEPRPAPPDELVALVRDGLADEPDVLATIYERAVTPRNRRRLGTFFTSAVLVEHMLATGERLVGRAPDVVVDPGAGVGAFSLAAARRWPDARVIAVDINVVTLGLLAARMDYAGVSDRAELVLGDFVAWLRTRQRDTESVWLTVGNPPFTRSQSLDAQTKQDAANAAGDMVASGHATLSTLFAAAVARNLEPQDAMALVLPAAWTYTRSARELREGLWLQRARGLELHRWPTSARAFTGPSVTATVIALGAKQPEPQPFVHGIATVVDGAVVVTDSRYHRRMGHCPDPLPGGAGRRVLADTTTHRLEEVFRSRRGVATGANSYFFLTKEEAKKLPDGATRPGICTLRGTPMSQIVLDQEAWRGQSAIGGRCHLLDIDEEVLGDREVVAWLARGRRLGLHERYLCRHRNPWYALEEMAVPDALLSPLITAHGLRIVSNEVGAIPSNSLYGLYLCEGVHANLGARVIEWLRGSAGVAALRDHGRQFAGGSIKLEPRELRTLPIPDHVFGMIDPAPATSSEHASVSAVA